ncbi:MAG TPA: outer membrane lipoprotein carrier protein LolA [Sphingorhabdus lacus]|jgi:outer membrane lipoprotein-sorting protein|uniref:Outer membrane lipoprotein carrier protein LolA n=1 Tax=Sphingorhabdus lacus TaxID=392610 RepID=A0A6I6LBD7_9SPHN|nr:outer membrane lipoprotein carrier protein LolA [Sphingorhabdus lacus]QGY81356.1 outer membrane lipoprotein carrier protein LolA [Sphingorhabdus lacus]HNW16992.1 outer membrane lipoprotein carrier protein LolA [Sphingorhabdus lacus]HPV68571.1 outer membrane lipoprotein carrier protein LolA [Sphingorhabdus lacus]
MTFGKYALIFAPVALVMPMPGSAQSGSAKMDRVVAHMQSVGTMTSTFTQTDRRGSTLSGKLLLKRPGHIRFEYQKGVPLLIVGDGKALTMVDYEVRQVQRWPIRNSPLAALLDPGQDLRRYGKLVATSTDDVISVEVRDPKRPEFGVITMVFVRQAGAPGGLTLNGWVALDSKNNRTSIRLDNVKYNGNVPNSAFTWKDPRPVRRKS